MIRDAQTNNFCINVVLKNGERFMGKDMTPHPFGQSERQVAFWHEGVIRSYPLPDVEYVELVPQED